MCSNYNATHLLIFLIQNKMSKILNLFNNTIEDYNKFVNNRAAIYIERINSSIKQIEDFIDSNKDAIIDSILVTQILNGFL